MTTGILFLFQHLLTSINNPIWNIWVINWINNPISLIPWNRILSNQSEIWVRQYIFLPHFSIKQVPQISTICKLRMWVTGSKKEASNMSVTKSMRVSQENNKVSQGSGIIVTMWWINTSLQALCSLVFGSRRDEFVTNEMFRSLKWLWDPGDFPVSPFRSDPCQLHVSVCKCHSLNKKSFRGADKILSSVASCCLGGKCCNP